MASGLALAALLLISGICFAASSVNMAGGPNRMDGESAAMHPHHDECPRFWERFRSRCYRFYYSSKSWSDAEDFCLRKGGNLASINSRRENDFVSELAHYKLAWVGGTDAVKDGYWRWSNGMSFSYTQWAPGEPNNYKGRKEDCMEINFRDSDWNDEQCKRKRPFVCSRRL